MSETATKVEKQKPKAPPSYIKPTPQQSQVIEQKIAMLEKAFRLIYKQRMADVPILNEKIEVSVIGFHIWMESYICVMITPWFMNLMLLPGENENWDNLNELSKQTHHFPSGKYTFITGYESDIGKYQMCSLFSPMFDFSDNNAAIDTASAAIKELLNVENIDQIDIDSEQIEGIWNGSELHPNKMDAESLAKTLSEEQKQSIIDQPGLAEKLEQPISRRQLLRGAILGDEKKP